MILIKNLNKLSKKKLIEDVYMKIRKLKLEIESYKRKNVIMKHGLERIENKYNVFRKEIDRKHKKYYQKDKEGDEKIWNLRNSGMSFSEISKKSNCSNSDCRKAYARVKARKLKEKKLKNGRLELIQRGYNG